jgi:hypothetical protein
MGILPCDHIHMENRRGEVLHRSLGHQGDGETPEIGQNQLDQAGDNPLVIADAHGSPGEDDGVLYKTTSHDKTVYVPGALGESHNIV